jgi:two-component system, OmpR family, phosphate regulon sensor histidine kinase PhoR
LFWSLPPLPRVVADHGALRRALCGLVENAIKYTPDGGSITLGARADGDFVAVRVADDGRGIRAEDLPRIFEKFYRGRDGAKTPAGAGAGGSPSDGAAPEGGPGETPGVGLGLHLARNIVEQFGGRIGVESAPGRGSTFTVYLPVWREGREGLGGREGREDREGREGR